MCELVDTTAGSQTGLLYTSCQASDGPLQAEQVCLGPLKFNITLCCVDQLPGCSACFFCLDRSCHPVIQGEAVTSDLQHTLLMQFNDVHSPLQLAESVQAPCVQPLKVPAVLLLLPLCVAVVP